MKAHRSGEKGANSEVLDDIVYTGLIECRQLQLSPAGEAKTIGS